MAKHSKRQSIEEKLSRLKELEEGAHSENAVLEIRQALLGSSSTLSARAARAAARLGIRDLITDMIAVFDRSLQKPVISDPGCRAKTAVVEALGELDYTEPDIFLRGIRHVQMEPSFGPPIDTADHLRAVCAFGLYRSGYADLLYEMVSLLVDREPVPRRAAVKVLTELGEESCVLLLRSKVLQGDKDPEVLGDCFNGLMTISPARSLDFVAGFLLSEDMAVAEEAALAIGNSRLRQAFQLLRDFRDRSAGFKRMLLLPIALTRCEEAFTLLLDIVRHEPFENAAAAVRALSIFGDNPERREEIREAAFSRSEPAVSAAYRKEIGHD